MKKQKEIFKPVLGFENNYLVTNTGRVWSIKRKRFLNPTKDVYGYYYHQLCDGNGYNRAYKLHRIVFEAFRGELPKNFDVDHLDGNKANNNINNLLGLSHGEHIRRHRIGKVTSEATRLKISESRRKLQAKKKNVVLVQIDENNYVLSSV